MPVCLECSNPGILRLSKVLVGRFWQRVVVLKEGGRQVILFCKSSWRALCLSILLVPWWPTNSWCLIGIARWLLSLFSAGFPLVIVATSILSSPLVWRVVSVALLAFVLEPVLSSRTSILLLSKSPSSSLLSSWTLAPYVVRGSPVLISILLSILVSQIWQWTSPMLFKLGCWTTEICTWWLANSFLILMYWLFVVIVSSSISCLFQAVLQLDLIVLKYFDLLFKCNHLCLRLLFLPVLHLQLVSHILHLIIYLLELNVFDSLLVLLSLCLFPHLL